MVFNRARWWQSGRLSEDGAISVEKVLDIGNGVGW